MGDVQRCHWDEQFFLKKKEKKKECKQSLNMSVLLQQIPGAQTSKRGTLDAFSGGLIFLSQSLI